VKKKISIMNLNKKIKEERRIGKKKEIMRKKKRHL